MVGVLRFARAAANFTAKIGRWPNHGPHENPFQTQQSVVICGPG